MFTPTPCSIKWTHLPIMLGQQTAGFALVQYQIALKGILREMQQNKSGSYDSDTANMYREQSASVNCHQRVPCSVN